MKKITVILLLIAAVAVLASCGGSGNTASSDTGAATPGSPAWELNGDLSSDGLPEAVRTVFDALPEETLSMTSLTPAALIASRATDDGVDYSLLCKMKPSGDGINLCVAVLRAPSEGEPSIISIMPLDVDNVLPATASGYDGWTVPAKEDLPELSGGVSKKLSEATENYAMEDLTPIALLAERELNNGDQYVVLCHSQNKVTSSATVNVVYLFDTDGGPVILNSRALDPTVYMREQ